MSKRTAKCIGVISEDNEFDDLIGTTGTLMLHKTSKDAEVNWFGGGGGVNLARKRVSEKNGVVTITTHFGNQFKFRILDSDKK